MLVLDRSYSMHYPIEDPKIAAAKNAARLYVNAAAGDDRLGLVTFNGNDNECDDDAKVKFSLKTVVGNRDDLIDEIDKIDEDGWTSIGDGLKDGRDELLTETTPADRHALVLLSDGLENEGDYWAKTNSACGTPAVKDSFDPVTGIAADRENRHRGLRGRCRPEPAADDRHFYRGRLLLRQHGFASCQCRPDHDRRQLHPGLLSRHRHHPFPACMCPTASPRSIGPLKRKPTARTASSMRPTPSPPVWI